MQEAITSRRDLNLKGLHAMDLRTQRADGTIWDFSQPKHRQDALRMQKNEKPRWMIGSPSCTPWTIWNFGINYKKTDPPVVAKMLEEGRVHLRFCAKLYRPQLRGNRRFPPEHPASAFSWREPEIDALLNDRQTCAVVCDRCQFGLSTLSADNKKSGVGDEADEISHVVVRDGRGA